VEDVVDLLVLRILQVQTQILDMWVGVRMIVFAAITNIEDMSDLEGIDAVCILGVMPVAKPESVGEDFVRVAVGNFWPLNDQFLILKAEVLVILADPVESIDTNVDLTQSLLL